MRVYPFFRDAGSGNWPNMLAPNSLKLESSKGLSLLAHGGLSAGATAADTTLAGAAAAFLSAMRPLPSKMANKLTTSPRSAYAASSVMVVVLPSTALSKVLRGAGSAAAGLKAVTLPSGVRI